MEKGIQCNIGLGWSYLKKVEFFELDKDRYDRRGRIVSLWFEPFPNREYHQALTVFCVRAVTALLAGEHTLMDMENYPHNEMNSCWVYWNHPLQEEFQYHRDTGRICVAVYHKYWSMKEVTTFKAIINALARRWAAEIVGYA